MVKLLKYFLKKLLPNPEYVSDGTIYDNSGYHMVYHNLYEFYDNDYDVHREYDYWDYK